MSACTAARCVVQAYPSSGTSSIARLHTMGKRFDLLKQSWPSKNVRASFGSSITSHASC